MEKIFRVTHTTNLEGMEFAAYQLKVVVYQWYEDWELLRGDDANLVEWGKFLSAFLNRLLPQELKEAKDKEFVNMNQGRMTVKQYELKFHQLSHYALEIVSSMRVRMSKFDLGLSQDLVLECKLVMLNNDMDICRMVVYI